MTYRSGMLEWSSGGGSSGPVSWEDVTGKPSTFTPSTHAHGIADVTELQSALDGKAAASHTHSVADIVGLTDPWSYVKLANTSTVSTTAYANVPGMSFTALANTTYLVEVIGAYQTAATTTGIGLALDIPSGSVIGQVVTSTSATALGGLEQIADATTTGATTGVRAINTNVPISGKWVIAVGATGGTVQLMQRSEIAGSNTSLQPNLTIMGRRVI